MENFNRLDAAAKLFPSVTSTHNSSVYRVAVILKEEINPLILQLAVNMIYERYNMFFRRLRKGFFWNYFDTNHIHFTVEEENSTPCSTIISNENKGYIIKVLYFGNRISVEAFHAITDGAGIIEFIKSLVYYYLTIKHGPIDSEGKILLYDEISKKDDEDSFVKNFRKSNKVKSRTDKKQDNAFRIKGKRFRRGGHRVISGIISIADLKRYCKHKGCTITALLIANMIVSIYKGKQKKTRSNNPIVVAVPVNLRKIFNSDTLKNFFGVVNVGYYMEENSSFEDVLASVTEQLKNSLNADQLKENSEKTLKLSDNIFSKHIPLVLKNVVIPVGFNIIGESKKTITISNIGQLDFPQGACKHIEHTELLLYPTQKSRINCGVCSFEDKLVVSFTSSVSDTAVIREFFISLVNFANLDITVYSNSWGDNDE